jgi:predicted ribosomally synthesized peptide with nif11-like leader
METIGCDKALVLLEQGWHDGSAEADFRAATTHLVDCPACASTVRSWSRVDSGLAALATAYDQATPRAGIAAHVSEALTRERGATSPVTAAADELELRRFLKRIGRETTLREQVTRAGGRAARLDVLVALARAQGFRFTEETVRRTLMGRDAANDGELSEAQLEAVAAGASTDLALLLTLLDPSRDR